MDIHELIKIGLQPRVAFALWVTAILLLIVPLPDFLSEDISEYKSAVSVIGLFAFVYWIVEALLIGWAKWSKSSSLQSEKDDILSHLDTLSPDEKFILARHLFLNQQTVRWKHEGEISALISKQLLESVPSESHSGNPRFTIPRFVWSHLQESKAAFIDEAKRANPDKTEKLEGD